MKLHMQPFYAALQQIIMDGEPAPVRKPISCSACLDSGELSEGGPCNWCALGNEWDGAIDGTTD
jgi:hypothetical protein